MSSRLTAVDGLSLSVVASLSAPSSWDLRTGTSWMHVVASIEHWLRSAASKSAIATGLVSFGCLIVCSLLAFLY